MTDSLLAASRVAASALEAQSTRMKVISENLANIESTGSTSKSDPYRRKLVTFESAMDAASGANLVRTGRITQDDKPFRTEFRPGHPAADEAGYVRLPNVNVITEMADMREATRSYEASLQVIKQAREMVTMTIDLMRSQ